MKNHGCLFPTIRSRYAASESAGRDGLAGTAELHKSQGPIEASRVGMTIELKGHTQEISTE